MDSAPNRAIQWVEKGPNLPLEQKGPNKGDDLIDYPIHTPLKASPHHLFRVTVVGPWVEEEG